MDAGASGEADDAPHAPAGGSAPGDARLLRDGLRSLQLSGAIFVRAHFSRPWAYESPAPAEMAAAVQPGDRRLILFHIFTEGGCRIALDTGVEADIEAGDIVILPFANRHRLGDPDLARPTPVRRT